MDRTDILLRRLNRSMRLIEIGPSFRPLIPKRGGWRTTVVDHAPRDALIAKYQSQGVATDDIEDVDVVWSGGDLHPLLPQQDHGCFDAIVSSHSMEHMPDPISFLASADRLLAPGGLIVLALPDKRYTFDFFKPITTTAEWWTAHHYRARTHFRRSAFNHVAYSIENDGAITWDHGQKLTAMRFAQNLDEGPKHFNGNVNDGQGDHYHDYHAWHFTPSSFALLVLESCHLAELDIRVAEYTPPMGHEFFAVLTRGRARFANDEQLNAQRLSLLKASMQEMRQGADAILGVL